MSTELKYDIFPLRLREAGQTGPLRVAPISKVISFCYSAVASKIDHCFVFDNMRSVDLLS